MEKELRECMGLFQNIKKKELWKNYFLQNVKETLSFLDWCHCHWKEDISHYCQEDSNRSRSTSMLFRCVDSHGYNKLWNKYKKDESYPNGVAFLCCKIMDQQNTFDTFDKICDRERDTTFLFSLFEKNERNWFCIWDQLTDDQKDNLFDFVLKKELNTLCIFYYG